MINSHFFLKNASQNFQSSELKMMLNNLSKPKYYRKRRKKEKSEIVREPEQDPELAEPKYVYQNVFYPENPPEIVVENSETYRKVGKFLVFA